MNTGERDYDIRLDDKYGSLALIDFPSEIASHEPGFNQTLTTANDAVVQLGIIEGEFHWHKHDDQDEFFLVLENLTPLCKGHHRRVTNGAECKYAEPRPALQLDPDNLEPEDPQLRAELGKLFEGPGAGSEP